VKLCESRSLHKCFRRVTLVGTVVVLFVIVRETKGVRRMCVV
jgi:hypothetical protein